MKSLIIADNSIEDVFLQLQQNIDGTLSRGDGMFNFRANEIGISGKFSGNCYSNSVSFIKCNLSLKEPVAIHLQPSRHTSFLYFIFCNKGKIMHKGKKRDLYRPIYQHQTTVINPGEKGMQFILPKELTHELIFIKINPLIYLRKEKFITNLDKNLQALYRNYNGKEGYTHYGSYNLKICDYFKEIDNIKESGLLKNIFMEGQIKLLLALLIKQYNWDILNQNKISDLTNAELKKVKEVSDYIKNNPSFAHSIKKLTAKYLISPSKLQKGFKVLHNRTVADFIKNLRIEIAEEMIKNRDCTISEIVYDIGFTSRSYFSKIFKEKYDCSPKNYQEKLKLSLNI
ncbi:helix-turn-helix domain-containing protein [Galbibacter pacificus]|uniref:AraC family transcriptional regulator n=1 Tax=Galbibacter pacificus TaxID=2996052 RepID=A0ABT6FPQ1_9FLAO|nr:AraC family transcriptional regulator [Galbibacter pacificus]MDG3582291.1 AraC family transcriptional regulator [Galbibacter pacificus]MDG3585233.1 AraC family transcriptional regulator [Galbibacter pacificus]